MIRPTLLATLIALTLGACASAPTDQKSGTSKPADKGSTNSLSALGSALSSGSNSSGASKEDNKIGAVGDLMSAASVSEAELKSASLQQMKYSDKKSKVAPAGNKYAARLARLTAKHVNEDGMKLNFKVYLTKDVNAFAAPDGSIRVYAGLMDLMDDDELRSVIGHEIGHVKHGHSLNALRTAYVASAARKAAASTDGTVGVLADSQLGALAEAVVGSQFSQSQETQADDYGYEFMKKHKYKAAAMESAFRKLAKAGGGNNSLLAKMLSSHPDPSGRADRVKDKVAKGQ
ncbi:M48 family metallopeptidase [Parachitinimonas caeni]|uniref:M48 family metallopeptidase n=1 Tax=Parachitinimonas caeni TaxID=3031301 RepID=A0ABT7DWB4_9NEIS|nr:M48 family metallopeptidase [Parachitinimonas caeni]MDK2124331.1 M48 family metallopeptidase [Parachitinimonas caeni]